MKTSRTLLSAGTLLAALSATPMLHAQTNEARTAFLQGVQQYGQQHFAEALESFRNAYRIRPHPSVLVNIANCYMGLNRPQEAITTFERFLNDPTVTPTAQQRAAIEAALTEARSHLATINLQVLPAGADVYLDGDLVGTAPLRRPLQTGPGPHVIEARMSGSGSVQHQARLEGGGTVTVTLDIPHNRAYVGSVPPEQNPPTPVVTPPVVAVTPVRPAVAVTPVRPAVTPVVTPVVTPIAVRPPVVVPPPIDTATTRRGVGPVFWTALTTTLVTSGLAIGFHIYANNLESDYNRIVVVFRAETDPSRRQYYQALGLSYADAVDQNRLISYITGGVAIAATLATVGAAVVGFMPRTTPRTTAGQLQLLPSFASTGGGNGLALAGSF